LDCHLVLAFGPSVAFLEGLVQLWCCTEHGSLGNLVSTP